MRLLVLLIALALLAQAGAACYVDLPVDKRKYDCDAGEECPPGQLCLGGLCSEACADGGEGEGCLDAQE